MTHRRTSFRQMLAETKEQSADRIFHKARLASHIAKSAFGHGRRTAYRQKARLLARLIEMGVVTLSDDDNYKPSLLLIQRPGQGGLHSHERWLGPVGSLV